MNIFRPDPSPTLSARALADRHVIKMALESAQILSTLTGGPYKPTHANHPCTLWAGESRANAAWLLAHGRELCDEYARRFGRVHGCAAVLAGIDLSAVPDRDGTPPCSVGRTTCRGRRWRRGIAACSRGSMRRGGRGRGGRMRVGRGGAEMTTGTVTLTDGVNTITLSRSDSTITVHVPPRGTDARAYTLAASYTLIMDVIETSIRHYAGPISVVRARNQPLPHRVGPRGARKRRSR